jgi:6-phosphogluconolactonase
LAQQVFADSAALASRLATDVATAVERRLQVASSTAIVVPGGRTPAAFLRQLAQRPLDWSRVQVLLADERCVPLADPASNQRMVLDAFAGSPAVDSLRPIDPTAPGAQALWQARLDRVARPFAAVVLGMGEDGHFASLFPGAPGLAAALDPDGPRSVVRGVAPVEPRERLSLALAALLDTDLLALHIEGPTKLDVLRRAATAGDMQELPVRALLQQRRVPLEIYCVA